VIGRAFVAVVPPTEVLDAVEARLAPLAPSAPELRWSRRDQRHLTLQFFGRVNDVDVVIAALDGVARRTTRFRLQLLGAGGFPKPTRAAVLWLGVGEGSDALSGLAGEMHRAPGALGLPADDQRYHPHLTVARVTPPRSVEVLVREIDDDPIGPAWTVDRFVLFASDTRSQGAVHTELHRFAVGA
jgi:RNA 2',3'-cyclic 3'-phosphodiesterase